MTLPSPGPATPSSVARDQLADLAQRLSRTMAVARGLVRGGRAVDLGGLEDGVGILCAQTLDRPAEEARAQLPALHALLGEVDSLIAELRGAGERQPP